MSLLISVLLGSIALASAATSVRPLHSATTDNSRGCIEACENLVANYTNRVIARDTTAFNEFTRAYWAVQQQSGGQGAFSGSSNIAEGIVVHLEALNETISDGSSTVTIGTGNTWLNVYEPLGEHGITVAGGRYPTVGVGGLSLGGGLSFFAYARGWTCDGIQSYELVTANRSVTYVSNASFPDLRWALRGGGNNFGIVTKITMEAFPVPGNMIWGGLRISNGSEIPALIRAAYNLGTTGTASDPGVGQIINIVRYTDIKAGVAILSHVEPVERPPVMAEFLAIPTLPDDQMREYDSTRVRTLTNMSAEMGGGSFLGEDGEDGEEKRRDRGTATFKLSIGMMEYAADVCLEEFDDAAEVDDLESVCVFQVITESQLNASMRKGGNALGLDSEKGPLVLLNIALSWPHAADDKRVAQVRRNMVRRTAEYAQALGAHIDFQYMNYASESQDVFAGYGETSKARLTQ